LIGPMGHGTPKVEFEITGGWGGIRSIVDVGGGTGAMLAELLRVHPGTRGTLVDLPRTVARARDVFDAAGVTIRSAAVGQSFFDPLPAGADLYLLKNVINDWPDAEVTAILRRCADAARPNGRIVVIGGIGPDNAPRGLTVEVVLCGGQYRSVSEFAALASAAGLEVVAAARQPVGYFVTECRTKR